jgi:uncharacterized protein CbrC (UPF0167 family)
VSAPPEFPYHPDPVATGFVERSDATCLRCGRARGFIYTGPVYAVEELVNSLCPWCIGDGSAAARFDATFTDDVPVPDDVPEEVVETITKRTPGFGGWQQEHWLYHCGDGAAFLGCAGWPELQSRPDALEALRREHIGYGWTPESVEQYLTALEKDGSPSAYLFRCRHCSTHIAYSDFD